MYETTWIILSGKVKRKLSQRRYTISLLTGWKRSGRCKNSDKMNGLQSFQWRNNTKIFAIELTRRFKANKWDALCDMVPFVLFFLYCICTRFLNFTNGTKSRKVSQMILLTQLIGDKPMRGYLKNSLHTE